jgi:hypothetical protein
MDGKIRGAEFQSVDAEPTGGASDRRTTDGACGAGRRMSGTGGGVAERRAEDAAGRGVAGPPEPFPLPLPGCVVWFMPDGGLRLTAVSRTGGGSTPTGRAALRPLPRRRGDG